MWSFAGPSDEPDVNTFTFQYFLNYNIANGWHLTSSPIFSPAATFPSPVIIQLFTVTISVSVFEQTESTATGSRYDGGMNNATISTGACRRCAG